MSGTEHPFLSSEIPSRPVVGGGWWCVRRARGAPRGCVDFSSFFFSSQKENHPKVAWTTWTLRGGFRFVQGIILIGGEEKGRVESAGGGQTSRGPGPRRDRGIFLGRFCVDRGRGESTCCTEQGRREPRHDWLRPSPHPTRTTTLNGGRGCVEARAHRCCCCVTRGGPTQRHPSVPVVFRFIPSPPHRGFAVAVLYFAAILFYSYYIKKNLLFKSIK